MSTGLARRGLCSLFQPALTLPCAAECSVSGCTYWSRAVQPVDHLEMTFRRQPTEGFERAPPLAKACGLSRPQLSAQTRDTAVSSLDPAVRNRKVQGRTQSLAEPIPASLRFCLLPEKALTAQMASHGVRVAVSTHVTALLPGASPPCPRRSSPPPYKTAALAAARRKPRFGFSPINASQHHLHVALARLVLVVRQHTRPPSPTLRRGVQAVPHPQGTSL